MFLFCLYWNDRNLLSVSALSLKTNNAVCHCEQCIITAASHIDTRMDPGSALSVKDISGFYKLTVRSLGSQSLGLGISAVLGRTDTFLMCEHLKVHI